MDVTIPAPVITCEECSETWVLSGAGLKAYAEHWMAAHFDQNTHMAPAKATLTGTAKVTRSDGTIEHHEIGMI